MGGVDKNFYYYNADGQIYLCVQADVPSQDTVDVFSQVQKKQPEGKVFVNESCGASADNIANGKCLTWWISR